MDPAVAATLIGIMVSALLGVFAGAFHLLRSDLRDLRAENRADHRETNARIDRLEGRFDRLEGKLDGLIMAWAQAGFPVHPLPPHSSPPPAEPQG